MEKILIAEDDRIHLMRLTNGLGKYADSFEVVPVRDGSAEVAFDEPAFAVTPGQAAAFYDGDELVGGGWIASATGTGVGA